MNTANTVRTRLNTRSRFVTPGRRGSVGPSLQLGDLWLLTYAPCPVRIAVLLRSEPLFELCAGCALASTTTTVAGHVDATSASAIHCLNREFRL